jgi:hypothetical protein
MNPSRLTEPSRAIVDAAWADEPAWEEKVARDRQLADRIQSPAQRAITSVLIERARASGAQAFALTGSTARGRRTAVSDLDYHVVGVRPRHDDLPDEVDIYAGDAHRFWKKLRSGDDFVQWTLRHGCVLFDTGIFRAGLEAIARENIWPDPRVQLDRLPDLRRLATRLIEMGDRDAAQEQVRAALTSAARALLLQAGVFPLARSEIPDQLADAGDQMLAEALARAIHQDPSLDVLNADLSHVDAVLSASAGRSQGGMATRRPAPKP